MKKSWASFLLLVFLIANTGLLDICKLPILVSHFLSHKKINNQLSFVEFIYLHYNEESKHASEKDHQTKLPFKSAASSSTAHDIIYNHPQCEFLQLKQNSYYTLDINLHYINPIYRYNFLNLIWQPPRA